MRKNTLTNDAMAKHRLTVTRRRSVKSGVNQPAFIHVMGSYNIPGVYQERKAPGLQAKLFYLKGPALVYTHFAQLVCRSAALRSSWNERLLHGA